MRSPVAFAALVALVLALAGCTQQPPAGGAAPGGGTPPAKTAQTETTKPEKTHEQPPAEQPVDPKALLQQLSDFYRQQQTMQVEYEQQLAVELPGMKNSMESKADISVERPNKIAIRTSDSPVGLDVVCDGEQLSIFLGAFKRYSQSPAPKSFDELMTNPVLMGGFGGRGPVLDILSSDPYTTLMEGVTSVVSVGREKLGDVDTQHLQFVQAHFDWELWIAADGAPRLVQAKFDMAKTLAASAAFNEQLKNAKMSVTQQYRNWQFDKRPPASAFVFEPPEGAKKVDSFGAGAEGEEDQPSPLLGMPAPDVELELLDGGHFSLKELQDKKIVILDFWATWCGPCIEEMPLVAKVVEEFRERDVALYCLNQEEHADAIRTFLKREKLDVTVVLDSAGEAGEAYGVRGIPMLVVINKAGVVQSVHVGFSPNVPKKLQEELDAILAGKDLAAEAERPK